MDGSENNLINICGMGGYALPKFESKLHTESRDYENNDREDSKKVDTNRSRVMDLMKKFICCTQN